MKSMMAGMTVAGLLSAAVVPAADWIGPDAGNAGQTATHGLERLLERHPLKPEENIKVLPLARTERSEHLLVQVRDREPLHYHADSDIAVFLLRGEGEIVLGRETRPVRAGDVLHIERGLIHAFINRGPQPAAALVVYSPPPGPKDRVLVDQKNK